MAQHDKNGVHVCKRAMYVYGEQHTIYMHPI